MTRWIRAVVDCRCAFCGATIAVQAPMLQLTIASGRYQVKRPINYCETCRGPAPPDLPAGTPRQQTTKRMTPLALSLPPVLNPYRLPHNNE